MNKNISLSLALLLVVALVGCDNDPVSSDDHPDPASLQVVAPEAGLTITAISDTKAFGNIIVAEGVQYKLSIEFLNEDGTLFNHGSDEFLEVNIENASLAEWIADASGSFTGTIRGVNAGTTTIQFSLIHGQVGSSSAHPDFVAKPLELLVVE